MKKRVYLEDYSTGEKLVSPARTVTESDIHTYAGLTGDWHPIHTDAEYAKTTPFGERIAHGMLTLCIGSTLLFRLGENVPLPEKFIAFYGMDQVRFLNPVKIGDTIRCIQEIIDFELKDEKRGVIVSKNYIRNQRDEDVCTYVTRALVGRKPSGK